VETEAILIDRLATVRATGSPTSLRRSASHRTILAVSICIMLVVGSGCGFNNAGEPRSLARQLGAPSAGDANVYCIPDRTPEICDVQLDAASSTSSRAVASWWLRAAKDARTTGVFTYRGSRWRWRGVTLTRPLDGHQQRVGWKCRGDAGLSSTAVADRMWAREPWRDNGIQTSAMATLRGCHLDSYSAPPSSNAPGSRRNVSWVMLRAGLPSGSRL
jgi:hypothetical protein